MAGRGKKAQKDVIGCFIAAEDIFPGDNLNIHVMIYSIKSFS
jgi:hypothetical protein